MQLIFLRLKNSRLVAQRWHRIVESQLPADQQPGLPGKAHPAADAHHKSDLPGAARHAFRWWWLAVVMGALLVISALAFATWQPIKVLPRIRLAPGFVLIDQDGQRLSNEDLRGQVVLYSFGYTRCGQACDGINAIMRLVQERLPELDLGDMPVTLLTISFDPEYDTPARLRDYAQAVGADPAHWRFATTAPDRLRSILGAGFEVYFAPQDNGAFIFDPTLVLVDGWGIIRGEYRYQTTRPNSERILRHLSVLAEEVRNSKGAARIAYEAAHLFLCYAP